jgi:glucose-1-phosphate cytidylyltransferase
VKVVLFCGGLGLRMDESSARVPKPMVPIGGRPILWHIMKYYAHFGHKDFVVCLGHRGEVIKEFFLTYNEALSNDFVFANGGSDITLIRSDIHDWRITFVDTGRHASVGERLGAVKPYLEGEDVFLATYGDGVTDAPLGTVIDTVVARGAVAGFLSVRPSTYSFHTVDAGDDGLVRDIRNIATSNVRVNAGFFVFRSSIFDYLRPGEDLVEGPFRRLIEHEALLAVPYDGFWAPMDTLKDKALLDGLLERGDAPWLVWEPDGEAASEPSAPALERG